MFLILNAFVVFFFIKFGSQLFSFYRNEKPEVFYPSTV